MISLYGPLASLNAKKSQFESQVGSPRRATVVGVADQLPSAYSVGASGWTPSICAAPYSFNATYKLDFPQGTIPPVATGKKRILVLAIGESGMVGYDTTSDWSASVPAGYGYPNLLGDVWKLPPAGEWSTVIEYAGGVGFGASGLFCWRLQQQLGSNYEVGLLPCAVGGTNSSQWAVNGTLFNTAVNTTNAALTMANSVLGCIIQEQGINDASGGIGSVIGWANRWTTIESALRIAINAPSTPLYFARHCATRPSTCTDAAWTQLLAEQDAWVRGTSPKRIAVQKPDGPWIEATDKIHLLAPASVTLSTSYLNAWIANPGNIS